MKILIILLCIAILAAIVLPLNISRHHRSHVDWDMYNDLVTRKEKLQNSLTILNEALSEQQSTIEAKQSELTSILNNRAATTQYLFETL